MAPRGRRAEHRGLDGVELTRPQGVVWLVDGAVAPVLRYPADALLVIGGPPGAGKSTLAARVLDDALDPDDVRAALAAARGVPPAEVPWPDALARTRDAYRDRLAAGRGAVLVTTAVRNGHRLGLARDAAEHGVACHLLMLDADLERCRAGRAAQGERRIPDGLFEHLVREWEAFRRALADPAAAAGFASVAVLDRAAVDALERIELDQGSRSGSPSAASSRR